MCQMGIFYFLLHYIDLASLDNSYFTNQDFDKKIYEAWGFVLI